MFITIEGIDGSGKTTQAVMLSRWLEEKGISCLLTKEPGSVILKECKKIRELILDPSFDLGYRAELFLYLADRAQHVEKCILPAKNDGRWIISDRYLDSTIVYQIIGRDLEASAIMPMIDYASHNVLPDLTFIMDCDPVVCTDRARASNKEFVGGDRIEREDSAFHNKLRNGFLTLAGTDKRYSVIDANNGVENIFEQIIKKVESFV